MIKDLFEVLKIKHYIKNLIVFIPLIFSLNFKDLTLDLASLIGFVSFCLISSAVYIFNDLIDKKSDLLHPTKKLRPIASNRISLKLAICLSVMLIVLSLGLACFVKVSSSLIIIGYFIFNILYSFYLKQFAIVDVSSIAFGFILRILFGCVIINVLPSPLVILLTFFTSMFFTFSKRKLEYENIKDKRNSIKEYNSELLNQYVLINAVLAIAFYFTYMLDPITIEKSGTNYLYVTAIPFTLVIYRLLFLVNTNSKPVEPSYFIYSDKMLQVLIGLYFLVLFLVLIF